MKYNTLIFVGLFCFGALQALAQDQQLQPQSISLHDFTSAVLENNPNIKVAAAEALAALGDYNQTRAVLLPQVSLSHTAVATNNPLMAFGLGLNQARIEAADFNPLTLNNPAETKDFATVLSVQQPLINMDGFMNRKAAKSAYEATALKASRTKAYMTLSLTRAYMELQLSYKAVAVLEKALKTANAYHKIAEDRYEAGHLLRSDILAVSVAVGERKAQLEEAKSAVATASAQVAMLMNAPQNLRYLPSDSLALTPDAPNFLFSPLKRADIKALDLVTNAMKFKYRAAQMQFLPTLNAFGSYELHDTTIFGTAAESYLFGAQLKWDLFKGGQKFASTKTAKANFYKAAQQAIQYKNESELVFNKAKSQLDIAEIQLETTAIAVRQLEEVVAIAKNRFETGLAKTSDVLESQAQLAQKSLSHAQAIFNYNYTKAYLKFLTQE
ncbi:TolC family protein [Flavobacteriaceae bacterium LSUCC0859]|nr:TolC family protein [Flavobacteriaceae bacterium LSUCC0859]